MKYPLAHEMQCAVQQPLTLFMHISEGQHWEQLLLLCSIESTSAVEFLWILIRPKQHIPPGDITIVVLMLLVLMVDAVHFRPLEEVAYPMRRLDIGVVEEFSYCAAEGEHRPAAQIKPK